MKYCSVLTASLALAAASTASAQLLFSWSDGNGFYHPRSNDFTFYNNCFVEPPDGVTDVHITQVDIYFLAPAAALFNEVTVSVAEMGGGPTNATLTLGTETIIGVVETPNTDNILQVFTVSVPCDITIPMNMTNPPFGGFWVGNRNSWTQATPAGIQPGFLGALTPPAIGATFNSVGRYQWSTATFVPNLIFGGAVPANGMNIAVDVFGDFGEPPCTGPASTVTETEICGEDTNGGCNAGPIPAYELVGSAPFTIAGTYWADGGTRDTDWFQFTVDVQSDVTVTIYDDFGAFAWFASIPTCDTLQILGQSTTDCASTFTVPCVPAGTYVLIVAPASFNGVLCDAPNGLSNYTVEVATIASDCPECGESANDCCVAGVGPSCSDFDCCTAVCAVDLFCCTSEWDLTCAYEASAFCLIDCENVCDVSLNDCCVASVDPGCSDEFCCNQVCAVDPVCCETAWDQVCVTEAEAICGVDCPGPCEVSANDCCVANPTPGCSDSDCCNIVCALDPVCCDTAWDAICAGEAVTECGLDCTGGVCGTSENDCCAIGIGPGCSDEACCNTICGIDTFCCQTEWDIVCAQEAYENCGICPAVPNDDCDGANPIIDGVTPFSTLGATDSDTPPLPPECDKGFGPDFHRDIWFAYEATCNGTATFSTCGTADFDTRLALYSDCDGTLVACNDDGDGCDPALTSLMTAEVTCGTTYYLRVGSFSAIGFGTGSILISCAGDCGPKCQGNPDDADFNNDGCVDGDDLGTLLGLWGLGGGYSVADLNCDGKVDGDDLGSLLGLWGCDD